MIAGDIGADLSGTISACIGTDQLISADVLTAGAAPVCRAQRAYGILIADGMAINGIERIGHICFPAATVAARRIGTINPVALHGICQIRLLLHPGIGGKRAGTLTQITYFISLILCKANQVTGTRRSVFSFSA